MKIHQLVERGPATMCRARFFVVLALAAVSSPQIVSPDGIEISDELEATLRCLVRTWIRFEWSQRCENCVVPTEDQLTEEQRLPGLNKYLDL